MVFKRNIQHPNIFEKLAQPPELNSPLYRNVFMVRITKDLRKVWLHLKCCSCPIKLLNAASARAFRFGSIKYANEKPFGLI